MIPTRRLALAFIAAMAVPISASAAELPTRKAGLWEMSMMREGSSAGMPMMQQCTDATIDKEMTTMVGNIQEMCSRKDIREEGGRIVIDSVCTFSGMKTTAHSEITGDFNSAYTVTIKSSVEGGPAPGTSTITIAAKWLSACRGDQRPGDIIMPGVKMNIRDLMNLRSIIPQR